MGYEVQTTGSNAGTWGSVLNDNVIQYLDQNFAGLNSLSLSSSNTLLTASQARNQMTRCSGVLLANVSISPDAGVLWNGIRCVENVTSGSFTVTLTNAAGSVVIPQGRRALVFLDTTNGPRIVGIAGSTGADPVPTGSVMLFYNAAAPTGWTVVAADDWAMRIASSAAGTQGGSTAYSSIFTSRTITQANLPAVNFNGTYAHTHLMSGQIASNTAGSAASMVQAQSTGGGAVQSEQPNTSTISVSSGGSGTAMDFAVRYFSMMLATKN